MFVPSVVSVRFYEKEVVVSCGWRLREGILSDLPNESVHPSTELVEVFPSK
jgi:hypothetical protein